MCIVSSVELERLIRTTIVNSPVEIQTELSLTEVQKVIDKSNFSIAVLQNYRYISESA